MEVAIRKADGREAVLILVHLGHTSVTGNMGIVLIDHHASTALGSDLELCHMESLQ